MLVDWLNTRMLPKKRLILNGGAADFETYLKDSWFCLGATEAIDAPKKVAAMLAAEREARKA